MKPGIAFFGAPPFAVPTLEALYRTGYDIAVVVTQPNKPVGRGLKVEAPAVKVKALELGLTVLQPKTLKFGYAEDGPPVTRRTVLDELRSCKPNLGIAVAYGKIIPKVVLDLFPRGVLNIHPSLLPKYRGPSPIQAAILNGDTETGVTIMLLDEEMDHGPILAQAKIGITRNDTNRILSETLSKLGAKLLVRTVLKWLAGEIKPQPQDHAQATFTKLLEREDGRIDWKKPAEYTERMVRAYDLWPETWTLWLNKRLKVLSASLLHTDSGCADNAAPGYVWKTDDGRLAINCNPGSIKLEQVQLQGKRAVGGQEFLRGHHKLLHATLS